MSNLANRYSNIPSFTSTFDNIIKDFDSMFMPLSYRTSKNTHIDRTPRANVYKDPSGYSIEIAVPGYARDDFEIDVEDGVLTVGLNGRIEDTPEEKNSIRRREWSYTSFTRSFTLPELTNAETISARYDAGILYVSIPVSEERSSRKVITVE
tara:strand:- start:128 stop:583 length:456 start_codon:yes stop_codon:yes gene_type:complete